MNGFYAPRSHDRGACSYLSDGAMVYLAYVLWSYPLQLAACSRSRVADCRSTANGMPKQGMIDPIDQYVAELLRAAGLDSLPEEARAGFVVKLRDQVQRRIGILAVQHLDPKGIEEFQGMMMQSPPPAADDVQAFLRQRFRILSRSCRRD